MSPERIQRKRSKDWKMPENTIYVGRPGKFGNPYAARISKGTVSKQHGEAGLATMTRQNLVNDFRHWLTRPDPGETSRLANGAKHTHLGIPYDDRQPILDGLSSLRGKNLACWCPIGQPCHADVLLELANA